MVILFSSKASELKKKKKKKNSAQTYGRKQDWAMQRKLMCHFRNRKLYNSLYFQQKRKCVCILSCWCLTLCDSIDPHVACQAPLRYSYHGIFQASILEWITISSSRGPSQPRDQTCISCVSCAGKWILDQCATWKPPKRKSLFLVMSVKWSCCFTSKFI